MVKSVFEALSEGRFTVKAPRLFKLSASSEAHRILKTEGRFIFRYAFCFFSGFIARIIM